MIYYTGIRCKTCLLKTFPWELWWNKYEPTKCRPLTLPSFNYSPLKNLFFFLILLTKVSLIIPDLPLKCLLRSAHQFFFSCSAIVSCRSRRLLRLTPHSWQRRAAALWLFITGCKSQNTFSGRNLITATSKVEQKAIRMQCDRGFTHS